MFILFWCDVFFWFLVVVFLVVWFGMLGYWYLIFIDEGCYVEIVCEMFVFGDWVIIWYNVLKYFEKLLL